MQKYNYYVYITTNKSRSTLYTGVTNNLNKRLNEHYEQRGEEDSFAGKYHCYNLVYFEKYNDINDALNGEKEIKKWSRDKKHKLIDKVNPKWIILNDVID